MIVSYFLTTRLEFYAFLNGDFTNYDQDAAEEESQTVTIEMADMTTKTNRNQLLTPRKWKLILALFLYGWGWMRWVVNDYNQLYDYRIMLLEFKHS